MRCVSQANSRTTQKHPRTRSDDRDDTSIGRGPRELTVLDRVLSGHGSAGIDTYQPGSLASTTTVPADDHIDDESDSNQLARTRNHRGINELGRGKRRETKKTRLSRSFRYARAHVYAPPSLLYLLYPRFRHFFYPRRARLCSASD